MIETTVRWIDRCDAYPEEATTVLVAVLDSDEPVWFGFTDGSAWFDAMTGEQLDNVTHWAELPMSPNPSNPARDDELICVTCNGSGQGMHDGTTCRSCGGKGIDRGPAPEDDPDAAERAWDDQQTALAERGYP